MLLFIKEVFFINNLLIDFYLKNNEENISKKNINAKLKHNQLTFEIENDKYVVERGKNISLKKENSDSLLEFNFIDNKCVEGKYYIKELDFYMDAKVKTNKIINKDNKLEINYELYLQDEYIGKFELIITVKE